MFDRTRKIALGGASGRATLVLPKAVQLRVDVEEPLALVTELEHEPPPTFDLVLDADDPLLLELAVACEPPLGLELMLAAGDEPG